MIDMTFIDELLESDAAILGNEGLALMDGIPDTEMTLEAHAKCAELYRDNRCSDEYSGNVFRKHNILVLDTDTVFEISILDEVILTMYENIFKVNSTGGDVHVLDSTVDVGTLTPYAVCRLSSALSTIVPKKICTWSFMVGIIGLAIAKECDELVLGTYTTISFHNALMKRMSDSARRSIMEVIVYWRDKGLFTDEDVADFNSDDVLCTIIIDRATIAERLDL